MTMSDEKTKKNALKKLFNSPAHRDAVMKAARESAADQRRVLERYRAAIKK